jgi:LuxR family transcriptional regulator, maltose regulon positive regulatory protein
LEPEVPSGTAATGAAPVVRGVVFRRALFHRIDTAGRVILVSAPAGSGKTFLLRSWIGGANGAGSGGGAGTGGGAGRAAWVSTQRGERDPQRFWISVADALRDTAAGSALVRPLAAAPDLDGWAIVERLLTDLAALQDRVWLVIDDVHELDSADGLRQLELLVMRAPPELRFVLATRHDLQLRLHRLRLEGELTEIRGSDLLFSSDEARALFESAGVRLSDTALGSLHERTEGWAAGLRLAALSLAGHPDPERFAEHFSGSERTVAEYLLAEVLEQQNEQVRRLLLRTSVLDRVNGDLADLLTGEPGGERILLDLEEASAFVVALDARRTWFRYHHLFADLLQLEMRRTEPSRVPVVHCAAAGWLADHGYPAEAIYHAQAAEDWGQAARLLSDRWVDLALNGQGASAHKLLARFPPDKLATDAELAVLMATVEVTQGSLEAAERQLARAAEGMASVTPDRRAGFRAKLEMVRLALAHGHGDLPAVVVSAQRLLAPAEDAEQLELSEDLRGFALIYLGTSELWALRTAEAERHLEQGAALARRIRRPWLEVRAMAHEAWAASFRSFALAVERGLQAIELAQEHGWTGEQTVAVAYAMVGAIRVWQMRLEEAEALLDSAGRALRAEVEPAAGLVFHHARGMLELARGRDADALAAFETSEKLAGLLVARHPRAAPMRAHMLQTLLRLGETERVESAFAEMDEQQRDPGAMRIAHAAMHLARSDPQAATAALAPVLDGSAPVTNVGWVTQAFFLEAIARDALGDPAAAGRALEHALDLAEPDGLAFGFLLRPAPELLKRHARQRTAHAALISQILNMRTGSEPGDYAAPGSPAARRELPRDRPPSTAAPARLTEPLSRAEARVLFYLPTNLTVPEIADQLYLSVNTVRTHTRHIYDKIGAHSRHQAVDLARALGLLAPTTGIPRPRSAV